MLDRGALGLRARRMLLRERGEEAGQIDARREAAAGARGAGRPGGTGRPCRARPTAGAGGGDDWLQAIRGMQASWAAAMRMDAFMGTV